MMSQEEVAHAIGISVVTYGNVERGRHVPHTKTIRRIAEFFGVEPAGLRDALMKQEA